MSFNHINLDEQSSTYLKQFYNASYSEHGTDVFYYINNPELIKRIEMVNRDINGVGVSLCTSKNVIDYRVITDKETAKKDRFTRLELTLRAGDKVFPMGISNALSAADLSHVSQLTDPAIARTILGRYFAYSEEPITERPKDGFVFIFNKFLNIYLIFDIRSDGKWELVHSGYTIIEDSLLSKHPSSIIEIIEERFSAPKELGYDSSTWNNLYQLIPVDKLTAGALSGFSFEFGSDCSVLDFSISDHLYHHYITKEENFNTINIVDGLREGRGNFYLFKQVIEYKDYKTQALYIIHRKDNSDTASLIISLSQVSDALLDVFPARHLTFQCRDLKRFMHLIHDRHQNEDLINLHYPQLIEIHDIIPMIVANNPLFSTLKDGEIDWDSIKNFSSTDYFRTGIADIEDSEDEGAVYFRITYDTNTEVGSILSRRLKRTETEKFETCATLGIFSTEAISSAKAEMITEIFDKRLKMTDSNPLCFASHDEYHDLYDEVANLGSISH